MYIESRYYEKGRAWAKLHFGSMKDDILEEGSTEKYDFYNEKVENEEVVRQWLDDLGADKELYVPFLSGQKIDITVYIGWAV